MSAYSIFNNVWMTAMLVPAAGVIWPLPFFRFSRVIALLALVGMFFLWIPISDALKAPSDVAEAAQREEARQGTYDDVHANPERYLSLSPTYSREFGVAYISGTLTNSSRYAMGNAKLKCEANAESGKITDRETVTIMERVNAGSSASFGPIEIGAVDPQAVGLVCRLVDADLLEGERLS